MWKIGLTVKHRSLLTQNRVISAQRQSIQPAVVAPNDRKYNVKIARLQPHKLAIKPTRVVLTIAKANVDLRSKMPPIYDQGEIGSCTANALCAAYQYDDLRFTPSRLFLYYNERQLEGSVPDDVGAYLYDGVACLVRYGVCQEMNWPYIEKNFAVKPSPNCYIDALSHKAVTYSNIPNTLYAMKQTLASGFPFVVAISIFESFETYAVARTGIVPMPNQMTEINYGGHAILIVGYDDKKQYWIARNSWGTGWGANGYFYLPYAYLLDANLASDLWSIKTVTMSSSIKK